MDGPTPGSVDGGRAVFDELWRATMPPAVTGDNDPGDVDVAVLQPDANGVVWRCVTYRPWAEVEAELLANPEGISAGGRFDGGGAMEQDEPGWHTTDTLDFGMVISGEIDLDLDDGTLHLKAGDAVVQRATRHAWRNRTDQPAVMAFVLISRDVG